MLSWMKCVYVLSAYAGIMRVSASVYLSVCFDMFFFVCLHVFYFSAVSGADSGAYGVVVRMFEFSHQQVPCVVVNSCHLYR